MEKLVTRQVDLFKRIKSTVENMKKMGAAKITKGVLTSRLELLEKNWASFIDAHEKIIDVFLLSEPDSQYFKQDLIGQCEEAYVQQKAILLDLKEDLLAKTEPTSGTSSPQTHRSFPNIVLPKFSGDNKDWANFRDLFESLIINNSSLSSVEKLHYLKTSVTGEPELLLKNITVTKNNFDRAWVKINERYQNLRALIQSHLKAIMSYQPMKRESFRELKELLNGATDSVQALETLKRPVQYWDDWLVFIIVEKLDKKTRMDWETSICSTSDPPTFDQLRAFLTTRLRAFEAVEESSTSSAPSEKSTSGQRQERKTQFHDTLRLKTYATQTSGEANRRCSICKKEHFILFCPTYKSMTPRDRKQLVTEKRLCYNCLAPHSSLACKSTKRCQKCVGKHHTSLHFNFDQFTAASSSPKQAPETSRESDDGLPTEQSTSDSRKVTHCAMTSCSVTSPVSVVLATAEVVLESDQGKVVSVRALIDPCSEVSLMEESVAQILCLKRVPDKIPVIGVGKTQTYTKGRVSLRLISRLDNAISYNLSAYVLSRLSSYQAVKTSCPTALLHLEGLELADPNFLSGKRINVILGADIYAQIIRSGLKQGPRNTPIAQATSLGWILTGPLRQTDNQSNDTHRAISLQCSIREPDLVETMSRFWQIEEVPSTPQPLTEEEKECEDHYDKTHRRDEAGRYIVSLPLKSSPTKLGESKGAASSFLSKLERRFQSNFRFQNAYRDFLKEYEALGHMERIHEPATEKELTNYLPHHGVLRESSSTTKLRVVFNASFKTSTGVSLNDLVHTGPNLLPEIFSLLLRWRKYPIVFSADVEKMYRQIRLERRDCDLQRIVWRNSPAEQINGYRLLTVTYGMACAPYLAIRTLVQLSRDEENSYPLAARCLRHDVYMDDVVSGANSLEEACQLRQQLIELLRAGGFKLRKWSSNAPKLLEDLPADYLASPSDLSCDFTGTSPLLGLEWSTASDCFLISLRPRHKTGSVTKRIIFSEIAGLYDPLGLVAPVVIVAKIFMQSLWLLKLNWDDSLPESLENYWLNFISGLNALSDLRIPRWIAVSQNKDIYELHGFADSSERAYAAVIYIRVIPENLNLNIRVKLIAAKTRVAPLKQVSLPRLELCAATLLVRLMSTVKTTLDLPSCDIHLWSDSSIVLSWLQQPPSKWKTFVANRVSEIQTTLPSATWRHVRSGENPADVASRGLSGEKLESYNQWWEGPPFLSCRNYNLDSHLLLNLATEREVRVTKLSCAIVSEDSFLEDFVSRYSSIQTLCKITSWCLRFRKRSLDMCANPDNVNIIGARELHNARLTLIRCVQSIAFEREKTLLEQSMSISRGPLLRLSPFLDEDGILRVGGRLKNALLDFNEKHPIILPTKGHFVTLLIREAHAKTLHGGLQLTLGTLRQRYWIISARRVVRTHINSCITCWRWRAKSVQQQMADLPATRVRPSRPFMNTGVDYAGPFLTKTSPGRGYRTRKSYVAVFVCLATRAVHLELVTDYTTEAFLAGYRRFISRRGICSSLRSDCGTNFVGADRELRRLFVAAQFDWEKLAGVLAKDGTHWNFNPPAAPHFGGIWEAAVKSMKYHLRRVVGDTPPSYEEMSTVLSQIEACLNSRPLSPLEFDSDSNEFLTPGHFLVGAPLTAIPEPSLVDVKLTRLNRWQLLQQMRDHFWRRWSAEYLCTLQARQKWSKTNPNVQPGDLCLVTSEVTPPTKWPISRILETYPGDDGRVRVVLVKTPSSTLKRPITKICLFPRRELVHN